MQSIRTANKLALMTFSLTDWDWKRTAEGLTFLFQTDHSYTIKSGLFIYVEL